MTMKIQDTLDLEDQDKSMFCFILGFFLPKYLNHYISQLQYLG